MKKQIRWRNVGRIAAGVVLLAGLSLACVSFAAPTSTLAAASRAELSAGADCEAVVSPCMLYPQGGTVPVKQTAINKITKTLLVNLSSQVSGTVSQVKGSLHPSVVLIADGYWEKQYLTAKETVFTDTGNGSWQAKSSVQIDIAQLIRYLDRMEEDTGIAASTYLVKVAPGLSGEVDVGAKAFALQDVAPVVLEFNEAQTTLRPQADGPVSFPVVSSQEFTTEAQPQPVSLSLLWFTLAVEAARQIAVVLILLPLGFFAWEPVKKLLLRMRSRSEEEQIDRRNRGRIIAIRGGDALQNKPTVELQSFQKLAAMAEQKELPLLKLSGEEPPTYLVIDTGMIYRYTAGAIAPQQEPRKLGKGGKAIESGAD